MSLIVLEGLDGSGKGTQTEMLFEALKNQGKRVRKITFPDYASPSSALVKMYLNGEFGDGADAVNAYAASAFYAVDRFASFRKDWQEDYRSGAVILCDRYTTSNMVYQLGKLPQAQWREYLSWAEDLEYEKLGLPRPSGVVYLDMPLEISQRLLSRRYEGHEEKKDIHERDLMFLESCRRSAAFAAKELSWRVVSCGKGEEPRALDEIHQEILSCVADLI